MDFSGLERKFDELLKEELYEGQTSKDARGNHFLKASLNNLTVADNKDLNSDNLQLTIDGEIQSIISEELSRGRREYQAKSAIAVMVDAYTGNILGMVQSPSVNLNEGRISSSDFLKNRVVQTSYEPGSVVKPLVIGYALDNGVITEDMLIDCENGRFKYGGRVVKDTHKIKLASIFDILVQSSNIGMSKIGIELR